MHNNPIWPFELGYYAIIKQLSFFILNVATYWMTLTAIGLEREIRQASFEEVDAPISQSN